MAALQRAKVLFDLNGFVHVPGVLSAAELAAANDAVGAHAFVERTGGLRNSEDGTVFSGDQKTGRFDMAGMLGWKAPHREVFREMLCHPNLLPYLTMLVGEGYRLDHSPLVVAQTKGSEGFGLHGGPLLPDGRFNPHLQYVCKQGDVYNTLLAVAFQLTDCRAGDGGFCVVRGSHKMNFAATPEMMNGEDAAFFKTCVEQPETRAGDVIIFSEATIHGCLPWLAEHTRRMALFRFAPSHVAFARGYCSPRWPPEFLEGMTPAQLAVMQPPFHPMYDRDVLRAEDERRVTRSGRSEEKKAFDEQVFGVPYY